MRRFVAPSIGMTGLLLFTLLACTFLGFWQVQRDAEKKALIARQNAQLESEPLQPEDLARSDLAYRRIELSGRWDLEHPFIVHREPNELRAGVRLLSPLFLQEPIAGFEAILVDRGWLPHSEIRDVLARDVLVETVLVSGMITPMPLYGQRPGESPLQFEWTYFQPLRHGSHVQRSLPFTLSPYLVIAGADGDKVPPHGGYERPSSIVNHIAYAVTWFTMAVAAAGLWVGLGFERGRQSLPRQ